MNNIWHKLPEQPEKGRDVLEKWQHLGIHYTHFVAKNGIAEDSPFTDAWCYLDDLIACENKLKRYSAALELIKNLSGAGMSYQDMVIEMREIAKWALDPNHKPLLIGRYDGDLKEALDTLKEEGLD